MKYRKMRSIIKFTLVNSELSTSEQCRHMRNMAGLCRTSHIRLWEKVRKRTVPDLRKTNRTIPPVTATWLNAHLGLNEIWQRQLYFTRQPPACT